MSAINKETLLEFELLTNYPIQIFFKRIGDFLRIDFPQINSYYSGNIGSLNAQSFKNLDSLKLETETIFSTIQFNKNVFTNFKWWGFVEKIEEIDNSLMKIDNLSKWLRSSISKGNFNPNPEVNITFNQGQTLESIERNSLGSDDWDNTWLDLAIKNDLKEEDYTPEGGFLIKANLNYNFNNFKINSIVDNPIGDKILGVDIDKKITFEDNDLKVLSPKKTFLQTVTIKVNLKKNDNPEFPDEGISVNMIAGSNINTIAFPILFRQLTSSFKEDDTIKSFSITEIKREQDAVFIVFNVESRLGNIQQTSLKI